MAEPRPLADAASASSEDPLRVPERLDPSRLKPGLGALPRDAFDPLKHEDWEQFWYAIDKFFQPIAQEDVRELRAVPVNAYSGVGDASLRTPLEKFAAGAKGDAKGAVKRENVPGKGVEEGKRDGNVKSERSLLSLKSTSTANSSTVDRHMSMDVDSGALFESLNSFPMTHRLAAALLDKGGPRGTPLPSALPNKKNSSQSGMDISLYIGIGSEPDVRSYQKAFEERVKIELVDSGLLGEKHVDEVQVTMRHEQWKLRDTKYIAKMRKTALYTLIVGSELSAQAVRREVKKHRDQVEMAYLERMVRNMKKNKKSRSKFQKLLQRMFGHYKDKDKSIAIKKTAEAITKERLLTNGEDKGRSSVKKKRKRDMGPPAGGSMKGAAPRKGIS